MPRVSDKWSSDDGSVDNDEEMVEPSKKGKSKIDDQTVPGSEIDYSD